ncbi:MAG: hypothetical protein WB217_01765 [Mesobacillus sp.]|uniref:hypothetical protein n=1 Tax=Mesobacillus sp. TaxID=2675271 RepID=UPI003C3D286C
MKKKRRKRLIKKYLLLSILAIIFIIGLHSCAKDLKEIKKGKAYEHMLNCENPYAFWQGVDGASCDDARRTYYEYTDEEWREEKKKLIDFGEITEQDYLYEELKKELGPE